MRQRVHQLVNHVANATMYLFSKQALVENERQRENEGQLGFKGGCVIATIVSGSYYFELVHKSYG